MKTTPVLQILRMHLKITHSFRLV
uniref:Uncharacterized protein n=1 Tax=Anguilla anguilla TaxID=7936 RepID=A0A0E9RQV9_ANGAN